MEKASIFERLPVYYWILYAFTIATGAVYGTFIPVYLNQVGFSDTQVGMLLAVGPLVAIAAQPFWGLAGDRARTKNSILRWMLAGSAVIILLYPLSRNFYYLFAVFCLFTFFSTSMLPLQDAITLEGIENTGWKYGTIRMAGTIGYAAMSVFAGYVSGWNIYTIFPLYAGIALVGFLTTYKIPRVKGHQSGGTKLAPWKLLKNRQLVLLTGFTFIIFITLGYYYSFFPIYYKQMGATNLLVGISMLLSSTAEIPFLLFANRIVSKLGIKLTLICAAAVMGMRWLLLYLTSNIYVIPMINILHGFSFIVCTYCLVTFINREVPKELRASGQTLFALVGMGISRILGSMIGGVVSDALGIRQVFLYNALINLLAVVLFGVLLLAAWRKQAEMDSAA